MTHAVCPVCGSTHVIRMGFNMTRAGRRQRYLCKSCKASFYSARVRAAKARRTHQEESY